jgi:signal transduction histidine kinase
MDETPLYDKIALLRLAFQGLEEPELQEMADLTELRTYPPGYVLCREGAFEQVFYIVADGKVEITKRLIEGEEERLLRIGGRGDMVGEMALIQNAARAATVRTVTGVTVLEMEKSDFETILSRSPRMAMDIIRITLDRIRANDQKMIADLQHTNQVLRQLDRNKLEFIQVAAHELRTPLTVLKGYVKMLGSFPVITENSTLGNVLAGVLKGADRMHEVVNLMLDVARIDAATLKVAIGPVPLKRLVNDLVHDIEKISDRPILISTQYAEEDLIIHGDPTLIHKALYQLAVNAIKYTPDGGRVTITTRPVMMDHHIPAVEIAVRDTGIGLDPEHHELVFEKFYQVGSVDLHSSGKTTFKGGGPGLGLAIVRGVARAHSGKAWVESAGHDEVNYTGSTFYLQLPVNPPKLPADEKAKT